VNQTKRSLGFCQ